MQLKNYISDYVDHDTHLFTHIIQVSTPQRYVTQPQLIKQIRKLALGYEICLIPSKNRKFQTAIQQFIIAENITYKFLSNLKKTVYAYGHFSQEMILNCMFKTGYLLESVGSKNDGLSRITTEVNRYLKTIATHIDDYISSQSSNKSQVGLKQLLFTILGGGRQIGRSCYLFRTETEKIIIDVGMGFSESSKYPILNLSEVGPINSVDAVIITHPHLDHVGALPFLVRAGYRNPIYMLDSCRTVSYLVFMDSYKLFNNPDFNFDKQDIDRLFTQTATKKINCLFKVSPNIAVKFKPSGHVLGGASLELYYKGERIYFTSDFNWRNESLLRPIGVNFKMNYTAVITEGTNINKVESEPYKALISKDRLLLMEILQSSLETQTVALFPVLLIGRGQQVIWELSKIFIQRPQLKTKIYVDTSVYDIFKLHKQHPQQLSLAGATFFESGIMEDLEILNSVNKVEVLMNYNIVVTTSGMLEGGVSNSICRVSCRKTETQYNIYMLSITY